MGKIKITRNDLYNEIWTTPVTRLAKKYLISDVGLSKICRRHHIPLPKRGHWAKIKYGKPSEQIPLPVLKDEQNAFETIIFDSNKHEQGRKADKIMHPFISRVQQYSYELTPEVDMFESLVKKAYQHLIKGKANERGIMVSRAKHVLNVKATNQTLFRAMQIIDVIFKACLSNGFKVSLDKDSQDALIHIDDEIITISIEEKIQRTDHVMSDMEIKRVNKDYYYRYNLPQFDYHPSGLLTLSINKEWGHNLRKNWSDGKIQRIESCIGQFLENVVLIALKKKADRIQQDIDERNRHERHLRSKAIVSEQEIESKRINKLLNDFADWAKANELREYILSVNKLDSEQFRRLYGDEFNEWKSWAVEQADRLDPLIDSPYSILDEEVERSHYW